MPPQGDDPVPEPGAGAALAAQQPSHAEVTRAHLKSAAESIALFEETAKKVKPDVPESLRDALVALIAVFRSHYALTGLGGFTEFRNVVLTMHVANIARLTVADLRSRLVHSQDVGKYLRVSWTAVLASYGVGAQSKERPHRFRGVRAAAGGSGAAPPPKKVAPRPGVSVPRAKPTALAVVPVPQPVPSLSFAQKRQLQHTLAWLPAVKQRRALYIIFPDRALREDDAENAEDADDADDDELEIDLDNMDPARQVDLYEYCCGTLLESDKPQPIRNVTKPANSPPGKKENTVAKRSREEAGSVVDHTQELHKTFVASGFQLPAIPHWPLL